MLYKMEICYMITFVRVQEIWYSHQLLSKVFELQFHKDHLICNWLLNMTLLLFNVYLFNFKNLNVLELHHIRRKLIK
jgi:hypothetical protein